MLRREGAPTSVSHLCQESPLCQRLSAKEPTKSCQFLGFTESVRLLLEGWFMSQVRRRVLSSLSSVLGITSLAGCGSTVEPSVRDGFEESLCEVGETVPYVTDLNPTTPADYIALRSAYIGDDAFTIVDETGPCPNEAICDALAEPVEDRGISGEFGDRYHLVSAQGEDITYYMTLAEVKAFLGTIDTAGEAALITQLSQYRVSCGIANLLETEEGYEIYAESGSTCGGDVTGYRLLVHPDGTVEELASEVVKEGDDNCVIGRIPGGLLSQVSNCPKQEDASASLGAYFAQVAHLEAASVVAFLDLARELAHHGAPEDLIERARQAAREETRHALLTGALARRFGAARVTPLIERSAPRPLLTIARENAVEGLTRETFGALLAEVQAHAAQDPMIREVMKLIARDETGHAEFSAHLHDWLMSRLNQKERDEVEQVRQQAEARFRTNAHPSFAPALCALAGLPNQETSRRLFDAMFPVA